METKHVKLFVGSSIIVNRLKALLEEQNIDVLVKNNRESGRLAGFGTPENDIELFVFEDDFDKAQNITNTFKGDINQ